MIRLIKLICVVAIVSVTNSATAQFSDNFDSYATGQGLHGFNGWKGWDNNPALSAVTSSAQALSAPNSVAIAPTSDLVNEMGNPTSGSWEVLVDQYIPSGQTGDTYFIMQNVYNDGGPYFWSIQLLFSGIGGTGASGPGFLTDDMDAAVSEPIVYDQWVPIRIVIDLDNDTCEQYYNGTLLTTGQAWTTRGTAGSSAAIGAIDLYSNGGSTVFYDNVIPEILNVKVCTF